LARQHPRLFDVGIPLQLFPKHLLISANRAEGLIQVNLALAAFVEFILGEDGRHVTIGRHSDPTDDELAAAADALRATAQGGWLAVTEGHYYRPCETVSVIMVRELAPTRATWESAVDAFQAARRASIACESHSI
jgi:hypothetical protein